MKKHIMERMRLGRHVDHDDRSWQYAAATAAIATVQHRHYGLALDQGNVGSCTGNAMAQSLNTEPFHTARKGKLLKEPDALKLYSLATKLDTFPGAYPPDDTGSSGLAVMQAAQQLKLIAGYTHSFSLMHLLGALTLQPGILGINWYDSFDSPTPQGECQLPAGASVRGGHEIAMVGLDATAQQVWCINSWGRWGYKNSGRFWFSWATLDRLLHERGDATFAMKLP